jgi:hypothetical protein
VSVTGHLLANRPWRVTPGGHYADRCACGLIVYGPTLPALSQAHSAHVGVVRAMSLRRHPSRKDRP